MRSLHRVGSGIVAVALLSGCHAETSPSVVPLAGSAERSETGKCAPKSGATLTLCVSIKESGVQVTVTDTIYGDTDATVGTVSCPPSGTAYLCAASFFPPKQTLNQVEIVAAGSTTESGTFPVYVAKPVSKEVILEGPSLAPISDIAVVPFHSTKPGELSRLPLGQSESVWIVATDAAHQVIIGPYKEPISIVSSPNAVASPAKLRTSEDAQHVTFSWRRVFKKYNGSDSGTVTATASSIPPRTSQIDAASGVIYYQIGDNDPTFGPGPVALSPDGKYVYVVINDDSDGGCRNPGNCRGLLERYSTRRGKLVQPVVALKKVPGVSQLYVTADGALWMATFQPVGAWNHPLPALRMPPNVFETGALQTLPSGFGEPSGFVADSYGNLWVSSCLRRNCKQDQNGKPVLVKTSIAGQQTPEETVHLPKACMEIGYSGYSVGDVAYYDGDLYVLGLNDGSGPPARGNLWRVSPTSGGATCVSVPADFNPSPYLSPLTNAGGTAALVFGAGGNNLNFHWKPNHGFYVLIRNGSADTVTWDSGPGVTANHVAASPAPTGTPGVLYYASSGKLDLRFSGLGTYEPSANPPTARRGWAIFPSASFSGDQSDNGVAATKDGAWYSASGVCGDWNGVCLAHAIYLDKWGLLPHLSLKQLRVGERAFFGVIINPAVKASPSPSPLHGHAGPGYYEAHGSANDACTIHQITGLTFSVLGTSPGVCQITVSRYRKGGGVISSEPLVTNVTSSLPGAPR